MEQKNMIIGVLVVVVLLLCAYIVVSPTTLSTSPQTTTVTQSTICNLPNIPLGCTWVSTANATDPCAGHAVCTSVTTTANSTTTVPVPSYTVKLATSASVGRYLVNASGYTLYLNSQDTATSSSCYGQCAYDWHPFYVSNLTLPANLSASKFGVLTRTGGVKQLTYSGYPLYQYIGDKAPGNMTGQGSAGFWLVVTYPNLTT